MITRGHCALPSKFNFHLQNVPPIIADVPSPTTEAPPAMRYQENNDTCSDKAYNEAVGSITDNYSASSYIKKLIYPIWHSTNLSDLSIFDTLQTTGCHYKEWYWMPYLFSKLNIATQVHIFTLFFPTPLRYRLLPTSMPISSSSNVGQIQCGSIPDS